MKRTPQEELRSIARVIRNGGTGLTRETADALDRGATRIDTLIAMLEFERAVEREASQKRYLEQMDRIRRAQRALDLGTLSE